MRIIFLGTPDFAVPTLEAIIINGFDVVAVVTAPDRPAGRGLQMRSSPVKECALKHNIPVLQPEKLRDEEFLKLLKSYNADLQVVVAFRMLPEIVWNMPKLGTWNLHASLLPNYRGAAPINHAVING
jgi:methionyl-tRNA formyltransferase